MNIDIVGIGNTIIDYPNPKDCKFEDTPQQYIELAKKIISYFGRKYGDIAKKMLTSEDAISNVATAIMFADWRWNADYKNKQGTVRSKKAYRNQCGLWAIQGYISRTKNNTMSKVKTISMNHVAPGAKKDFCDSIPDVRALSPIDKISNAEQEQAQSTLLNNILNSTSLSQREKEVIDMYYMRDMTLESIGKVFNVNRQRIHQNLHKGLSKLKGLASET
jgi:RNA polymerase sigma factor (sigma-70 family)